MENASIASEQKAEQIGNRLDWHTWIKAFSCLAHDPFILIALTLLINNIVDPWNVQGAVVDGKQLGIDYDRLIESFGTRKIDEDVLKRLETLTGRKPHVLLRRGVFFSHR